MNENIFNRLKMLIDNALDNFSNYKVSCVVQTDTDEFYGVNVEPDVLNLGICAERNAIFSGITKLGKNFKIRTISIFTTKKNRFGTPCGGCRQIISQFSDDKTEIYCFNLLGEYKKFNINELLPHMWSKKDLI